MTGSNFWDVILFLLLAFVVLGVLLMLANLFAQLTTPWGAPFKVKAKVKSLSYQSSQNHTGTGLSSGGQLVVTNSYAPEKWEVVLKLEDSSLHFEDDEKLWKDVEIGEDLILEMKSKIVWGEKYQELISWKHK